MIIFDEKYFKKMNFTPNQVNKYMESALNDLMIAEKADFPEVKFQFSYNCLVKLGIAISAVSGYKVSSRAGHHIKILEKMSEVLGDEEISVYGDKMRKIRNRDLYDGGMIITKKQAGEYFDFVKKAANSSGSFIKKRIGKLI